MNGPARGPSLGDLPVADPWFVVERFDDRITLVTEPHVHPLLRCNVWLVRGRDRSVVVDTGLGLSPLRDTVEAELSGELLAVATHSHGDHVGGLHEFESRAAHGAATEVLASADVVVVDAASYPESVLGPYRDAGYEIPELFLDAVPAGGLDATVSPRVEAAPGLMLDDGDVIDLGDRRLEVLHLPGHSPDSIGLWEPATGTLFAGDAVYDGPLLDELEDSDVDAYCETMRRLRSLPVRVVHAGHEPSFDGARLIELCDAYLAARS